MLLTIFLLVALCRCFLDGLVQLSNPAIHLLKLCLIHSGEVVLTQMHEVYRDDELIVINQLISIKWTCLGYNNYTWLAK